MTVASGFFPVSNPSTEEVQTVASILAEAKEAAQAVAGDSQAAAEAAADAQLSAASAATAAASAASAITTTTTARDQAVAARTAAETAASDATAAATETAAHALSATAAASAASSAASAANSARDLAQGYRDSASEYAVDAAASETAAQASAGSASTAASNAETARAAAVVAKGAAETAATTATGAASTATTKAGEASASATTAQTQATTATNAASAAEGHATTASGAATVASSAATTATTKAGEALASAEAAAESAADAAAAAEAASGGGIKVTITDTTPELLDASVTVSGGLTKTVTNPGANERLSFGLSVATTTTQGAMSAADKTKLDAIPTASSIATKAYADNAAAVAVAAVVDAAPAELDTLREIAEHLAENEDTTAGIIAAVAAKADTTYVDAGLAARSLTGHTHTFASLTSKPTTLSGYGITDAAPSSHVASGGSAHAAATTSTAGFLSAADKTKLDGITAGAQPNALSSVFGRTGAVVAASGDYTAAQITNTPAGGLSATTVQAAINELDVDKAATTHDHTAAQITNTPAGTITATTVQAAINALDGRAEAVQVALSNMTGNLATGTAKGYFPLPYDCDFLLPMLSVWTPSSSGIVRVDINLAGVSICSTRPSIDASEQTSLTAATPAVLSTTTGAKGQLVSFDIDDAGTGAKGLIATMYLVRK